MSRSTRGQNGQHPSAQVLDWSHILLLLPMTTSFPSLTPKREIFLGQLVPDGELVVVHIFQKTQLVNEPSALRYLWSQRNLWVRALEENLGPFLSNLLYVFQTKTTVVAVFPYELGGLLQRLVKKLKKRKKKHWEAVKFITAEMLIGFQQLNNHQLVCETDDLLPNIMIDKAGHLKFLLFTNSFESCLEPKIDLYSFGVLLYQLVHNGKKPFKSITDAHNMSSLSLRSRLPAEYTSLLGALLTSKGSPVDKSNTSACHTDSSFQSWEDVKRHAFFNSISWEDVVSMKLKPPLPTKTSRHDVRSPIMTDYFVEVQKDIWITQPIFFLDPIQRHFQGIEFACFVGETLESALRRDVMNEQRRRKDEKRRKADPKRYLRRGFPQLLPEVLESLYDEIRSISGVVMYLQTRGWKPG